MYLLLQATKAATKCNKFRAKTLSICLLYSSETMLKSGLLTKLIEGTGFGIRLVQELPLVLETASTAMVPSWSCQGLESGAFAMPKMPRSYAHVGKWNPPLNHKSGALQTSSTSSTLAVETFTLNERRSRNVAADLALFVSFPTHLEKLFLGQSRQRWARVHKG